MPSTPRVGFAGLGAMGAPMAHRIRSAGFELAVWNRSPAAAEAFAAAGVTVAPSPAALARQSDVVVSMLFDDAAVRETIGTVIAAGRPGLTVVEMSTVAPATARDLHATAAAAGIAYVDAPVSGSTPQAEAGQLLVLAGGDAAAIERVRPVLLAMGKAVEHLGGPGAGATAKLAINAMLAIGIQSLAEGLALAEGGGLDRKRFLDAVGQTAVVSPGQKSKFANAERDQYPSAFALKTAAKDLRLIADLADQLAVSMPTADATRMAVDRAVGKHADEDFSVLIKVARAGH